jgi:hypothetical protein
MRVCLFLITVCALARLRCAVARSRCPAVAFWLSSSASCLAVTYLLWRPPLALVDLVDLEVRALLRTAAAHRASSRRDGSDRMRWPRGYLRLASSLRRSWPPSRAAAIHSTTGSERGTPLESVAALSVTPNTRERASWCAASSPPQELHDRPNRERDRNDCATRPFRAYL